MTSAELQAGSLRYTIGDNSALGKHNERYNGVFQIEMSDGAPSPFVSAYAGLNLEHFFDLGPVPEGRDVFFEPRVAPMTLSRAGENALELFQAATPHYGVESRTRFEARAPYYLDMTFRCIPRKTDLTGGVLGVFWASYIDAPEDKSIYFIEAGSTVDRPVWVQYCTQLHGRDSTVCGENDHLELTYGGGRGTLFNSISPLRYGAPFFYGRFRDRVLIYIFEPGPCIRFSHSPSGGGPTASGDAQNPAWDFQMIVPGYETGREYALRMRLVYKPWAGRADVIEEARRYLAGR